MPSRKPAGGNRPFSYVLPFGKFAVLACAMLLSFPANASAELEGHCVGDCPNSGGGGNGGGRGNRGGGPIIPRKTPAQIRQEKIAALLKKAEQARRDGRLKQAVEFLYAALQLDPKNPELLARYRRAVSSWKYSEGVNQFGRGNADRAYALLEEALRYSPDRQGSENIRQYMRRKVFPHTKKGKIEAFYVEQARKKAIEKKAKSGMNSQVDGLADKLEGRGPKNRSSALREISSAAGGAKGRAAGGARAARNRRAAGEEGNEVRRGGSVRFRPPGRPRVRGRPGEDSAHRKSRPGGDGPHGEEDEPQAVRRSSQGAEQTGQIPGGAGPEGEGAREKIQAHRGADSGDGGAVGSAG